MVNRVQANIGFWWLAGQPILALLSNGTLVAWGDNRWGQSATAGIHEVKQIACGTNFKLALHTNGQVLASGTTNLSVTNVPFTLSNVVAIAAGGSHALAIQGNGIVIGWGASLNGQAQPPTGTANIMGISVGDPFVKR